MSVKDFIKNSILDNFSTNSLDVSKLIVALLLAFAFGLIIFMIYSKFYGGVIYSRSFAITLVGMTVLTCMVTLAISTNVVISLGMVGSLSVIRYRTAVKDPMDLMYMFWAVTVGITIGANMVVLAAIASVAMLLLILIMQFKPLGGSIYIAVIHYTGETTRDDIVRAMGRKKYKIKSQTMYKDKTELAIEVYCEKNDVSFVEKIRDISNVADVTLVQYNGEYHG